MRKIAVILFLILAGLSANAAQRPRKSAAPPAVPERIATPLTETEKKWLGEDVVYIISERERRVFLALDSHDLRDKFITEFWRQRDPSVGTEQNEVKEEHYRRIAYANDMFGARSLKNGWRTERGRVYILLGEPQSKTLWTGTPGLKDIELWFYEAGKRIRVSAFFRVVFYRREISGDYRLYDPTVDGPEELVEGPHMIAPTRTAALNHIQKMGGLELWQAAQTLIPSEPVGMFSGQSQLLLNSIENLRNTQIEASYADIFLSTRGYVASRLTFRHIPLHFLAVALYNQHREAFLHAGFEIAPEHLKAGRLENGRVYAALTIKTFINDFETNKALLERSERLEFDFAERDGKILAKPLAFQQVLPLVPGKYRLGWVIEDEVGAQFTWHSYVAEIVPPASSRPQLTVPLLSTTQQALSREEALAIRPFRIFNVQYAPRFARLYNLGDRPGLFFEYLYPVADGKPQAGDVDFVISVQRPLATAAGQAAPEVFRITHRIARESLPSTGIAFIHRQIPPEKLEPGEYEIVVRAQDSQSGASDEQRIRFTFRGSQPLVRPTVKEIASQPAYFGEPYLLERLKQYRALGRLPDAIREAEAALARTGMQSAVILNELAEVYSQAGDRAKALATLQRSLAADPTQTDVRARIQALSSIPSPTL